MVASGQPIERWIDPGMGSITWQTLFSKDITPTDSITCGIAHIAPGDGLSLHRHPHAEVYFGISGSGTIVVEGQAFTIAPGVALFVPGNALHSVPESKTAFSWLYVFAADSFADVPYTFVT
jgi:mannose-6-phosphate isomerase-like protein (cupin superfamily)